MSINGDAAGRKKVVGEERRREKGKIVVVPQSLTVKFSP
jgi:hypothetical protein